MLSRVALTFVLASTALAAARAQNVEEGPTREEQRLAREAAAAFAERLTATRDFGPVVREMFAADFMARHLASEASSLKREGAKTFMLRGVPSLEFDAALAARRDDEHWPRLYVAAANILHYTYLSVLARRSLADLAGPDKRGDRGILAVFPPEAVRLLERSRLLSNFLLRKGDGVVIKTPGDLREATATLEQAARLVRPRLEEMLAAGASRLSKNLEPMREASERAEVGLLADASRAGYPKGTRLLHALSPLGYDLLLLSEGGAVKILWAGLPHD